MKTTSATEKEIIAFFNGHNVRVERNEYGNFNRVEFTSPSGEYLHFDCEYGLKAKKQAPPVFVDQWKVTLERTDGFSKTETFDDEASANRAVDNAKAEGFVKQATVVKETIVKED